MKQESQPPTLMHHRLKHKPWWVWDWLLWICKFIMRQWSFSKRISNMHGSLRTLKQSWWFMTFWVSVTTTRVKWRRPNITIQDTSRTRSKAAIRQSRGFQTKCWMIITAKLTPSKRITSRAFLSSISTCPSPIYKKSPSQIFSRKIIRTTKRESPQGENVLRKNSIFKISLLLSNKSTDS